MSQGTRVTLLRHGTTDANVDGLFLGQTDVSLNDVGRAEAEALGRRLAGWEIDHLRSSDLIRARDTAAAVGRSTGLTVTEDPRFREMHLGDLEAIPARTVHSEHPELMRRWLADPGVTRMPGAEAETLREVQARAWAGVSELVEAFPGGHIAVVTHTFTLLMIICAAVEIELPSFRRLHVDRASITRLEWRKFGATLRAFNDTAHLNN